MTITTDGSWFKDEHGRTLHLRGVNLGGSSKVPVQPNGATHLREGFFEHRQVSFVGRPFPLAEADEHFRRLKSWGLTFLRFLVTWEAIEHSGPGLYDEAYLDYVRAILQKAQQHGFTVFIDPHQDVWSRFSGGDGAPGWTFEAIGMDISRFKATAAAIVHQTHGDPFPRMVWPANYSRLAAATLLTLFFGGNDFAPQTRVDGVPVQDYLQGHYCRAMQQLAARLRDLPAVIGYDTLNEPAAGYIGVPSLGELHARLKLDATPTAYQSMLLGAGYAQDVNVYALSPMGTRQTGITRLDPKGVTAWLPGYECVWQQNGVWGVDDLGRPQLLRPHHFARVNSRAVHFEHDYLRPFALRYAAAIREAHPGALIFFEPDVLSSHPPEWSAAEAEGIVYAPHWYDAVLLFNKQFRPWLGLDTRTLRPVIGRDNVQRSFNAQLKAKKDQAQQVGAGVPTVIGEIGIPYDLNGATAYRTGDYRQQAQALERSLKALEANLLSFTLWNYTADNSHARGDQWNGEDLSIYSPDDRRQPADLNSGGRALAAVVRPYARATAGRPVKMQFDSATASFEFAFWHDPAVTAPTEFYLPALHYGAGCQVQVSDGDYELDLPNQRLIYRHSAKNIPHHVRVLPAVARPAQAPPADWRGALLLAGVALLLWRVLFRRRRR